MNSSSSKQSPRRISWTGAGGLLLLATLAAAGGCKAFTAVGTESPGAGSSIESSPGAAKLHSQARGVLERAQDATAALGALELDLEALALSPQASEILFHSARAVQALHWLGDDGDNDLLASKLERVEMLLSTALEERVPSMMDAWGKVSRECDHLEPPSEALACMAEAWRQCASGVQAAEGELAYWLARVTQLRAHSEGIRAVIGRKNIVLALVNRVAELGLTIDGCGPSRLLGTLAARFPFPEGNRDRSKRGFDAATRQCPDYLMNHVVMATVYATKWQDIEVFDRELRAVGNSAAPPANVYGPENHAARKRAAELLAERENYFY